MSFSIARKFPLILFIVFSLVSSLFSGQPMEAAKRNISVFQHGINPDKDGLVGKNCDAVNLNSDSKLKGASKVFLSNENYGYVATEVLNSFHHLYIQNLSHPGWSPKYLGKEFGSRDYVNSDADMGPKYRTL